MAYSISYLRRFVFVAGAFALGQAAVRAEVKLPSVFGDHMVLQQGQRLPVWGWAEPWRVGDRLRRRPVAHDRG